MEIVIILQSIQNKVLNMIVQVYHSFKIVTANFLDVWLVIRLLSD